MTEDEARSILEAIRKVSDLKWDAMPDLELLELRLRGLSGRAFAATHRIPDPDHPQRTAPCLYVVYLPDPESFLLGSLKHELGALEVPGSVAEIDGRKWVSIDPLGSQPEPEKSGRSGGRDGHALEGFRWKRTSALAVTAVLCLFVWWAWIRKPAEPDRIQDLSSKTPPMSPANVRRWNETSRDLRSLLRQPWAKANTGINDPEVLQDHELLNAFARLFKRPDISQLPDSDRLLKYMETEFDAHPFTGFLHRLPEVVPSTTRLATDGEHSRQGLDFLSELASALKESGINLDTNTSEGLTQSARLALDYRQFFEAWRTRRSEQEASNYWCEQEERHPDYKWVAGVRSIIKTNYPFYGAAAEGYSDGH